jgi:hypothetical protein
MKHTQGLAIPTTLQDVCDPQHMALLVYDMQVGICSQIKTANEIVARKPTQDFAERRQVTVMFSDLVGSTALSARMDPEDLRKVISAYHKCVADTVARFSGFVAKYMGDGVLVYFGYPHAHEDDAERAVRSGLALIAAVIELNMRAPLQTRVGIATGLVVVGDLVGFGEAQERGIVGRGKLADAIAHIDAGMDLYDEVRHARHRFVYMGHDPAACALSVGRRYTGRSGSQGAACV